MQMRLDAAVWNEVVDQEAAPGAGVVPHQLHEVLVVEVAQQVHLRNKLLDALQEFKSMVFVNGKAIYFTTCLRCE